MKSTINRKVEDNADQEDYNCFSTKIRIIFAIVCTPKSALNAHCEGIVGGEPLFNPMTTHIYQVPLYF